MNEERYLQIVRVYLKSKIGDWDIEDRLNIISVDKIKNGCDVKVVVKNQYHRELKTVDIKDIICSKEIRTMINGLAKGVGEI